LISISDLSSGELLENFLTTEDLQLSALHQSNWDSVSTTKKESTEAVGVHLDGEADDEEEPPRTEFKFGSDKEDTPDENIEIPATDAAAAAEEQLEQLASNIPTNVSTKFTPTTVYKASTPASTMASIAATTTVPPATILGRTARFTVPS
jgi:hypothetical protein